MAKPQRSHERRQIGKTFAGFSSFVAKLSGRPPAFFAAVIYIIAWAASGPLFGFSDTWQLVMNTMSSIVTFLMVFIIQNTQERDSDAVQAKLDEIVRAIKGADNRFIRLEELSDKEIEQFRARHGPRTPRKR
jgi:low affinity Fe/Cu permease